MRPPVSFLLLERLHATDNEKKLSEFLKTA